MVKFEKPTPKFLRKPLVYDSMHTIGIEEAKYLPLREKNAAANAGPTAIRDGPYKELVSAAGLGRASATAAGGLALDDRSLSVNR